MPRHRGNGSLITAALILGLSSLLSRIVGLIRERVFTTQFGAGDTFDAFIAAFRIPDLIFNLVVIGALSAAFIPLFTDKIIKQKRRNEAFDFANAVLTIMMLVVGMLCIGYGFFASYILPVVTPGFTGQKLETTIMLSRIMAAQPFLLAISFVFSGVLNSFKRFIAYALAPIFYNIGIIFGVLVLVPEMGIRGIAWGVVIGAGLHVAIQFPSMRIVGWRYRVLFGARKDLVALWRMLLPRVFGLAAQQVNLLVVTILGSGLLAGSISVFHLANNIQHLPIGIFGIAFAQAAFPTLAEQVSRHDLIAFRKTLTRTFRYILFFVIPISVLFFVLRAQIVRVLFGDGAFDWEDTILTFETLKFLTVSISAQAVIPLLTRAFYARQDTRTPVVISFAAMALNIVAAVILSPIMGVRGLAIAFSLSAIFHCVLLLSVLHWQLAGFDDHEVLGGVARMLGATILAVVVAQLLKYPVAAVVDMQRFWGVLVQLAVSFGGGAASYIGASIVFHSKEVDILRRNIPRSAEFTQGQDTPRFGGIPE